MSTIALYVSSRHFAAERLISLLKVFDTSPSGSSKGPLMPEYIRPPPHSDWAVGLSAKDIFQRHVAAVPEAFSSVQVVVVDDRTIQDDSLLIFYLSCGGEEDENGNARDAIQELRVAPDQVSGVAVSLEIANMGVEEFQDSVDEAGVFRGFEPLPDGHN